MFVVVTLLVALGIAAAQGCQGPSRGLGDDSGRSGGGREQQRQEQQVQMDGKSGGGGGPLAPGPPRSGPDANTG